MSLVSLWTNIIDKETFAALFYNANTNKFDLDNLRDNESKAEFTFYKNDIFQIIQVLRTPEQLYCYIRVKGLGTEALSMFFWPKSLLEYDSFFCTCSHANVYDYKHDYVWYISQFFFLFFLHFLLDFNQQWSSPESLSSFANEVKQKEVSLQTWWVLLMARCVLFVDHSKIKEYFKMGIKEFRHLS